jgi:hypothetical protein
MSKIILTEKGERWMLNTYRVLVTAFVMGGLLLLMGFMGWIEGGM